MTEKRKRCSLSVAKKRQIIKYVNENLVMKKIDIAKKFEILSSTLATILKFKERFSEESEDENDDLPIREEFNFQDPDFEEFVTFDNDVAVCGELTDADIVASVLPVANEETEEGDEEEF
ncbi:hypothetical protein KQX54_009956 [Cotesia glomerata]|uniref:HTH psq-type domain-containing protein n=1 Tax=Cotesia glomerata TaxID=32391 RepID=A0AAV7HYQ4_COTGL|nr:hypothetical protein KQX54_009956 [Cotesia glomerata]